MGVSAANPRGPHRSPVRLLCLCRSRLRRFYRHDCVTAIRAQSCQQFCGAAGLHQALLSGPIRVPMQCRIGPFHPNKMISSPPAGSRDHATKPRRAAANSCQTPGHFPIWSNRKMLRSCCGAFFNRKVCQLLWKTLISVDVPPAKTDAIDQLIRLDIDGARHNVMVGKVHQGRCHLVAIPAGSFG